MISSFRACYSSIFSRTSLFVTKSASRKYFLSSGKTNFQNSAARTITLELSPTIFQFQCYSTKRSSGGSSRKGKSDPKPVMKDDREAFFVVRKGDLVGVYKSLSDCQAQVGTSICDPPVSVYKGNNMPKDTEKYLISCGLKNALYSIRASDLTEELFGTLVACPFQPSSSRGETSSEPVAKKRSQEALWSEYGDAVGPLLLTSSDAVTKHFKLEPHRVDHSQSVCVSGPCLGISSQNAFLFNQLGVNVSFQLRAPLNVTEVMRSCTLEFDGASKGNPGQAGAGAIIRSDDGNLVCRLREGLGIATNNVAEYRGFILGLKFALAKGFTSVRVRGDSKLVCMQVQGLWRVKNQNISSLFDEAKKLKDRFLSFQIIHILRDLNSEADALANLAVDLAEGQVQEEIDK